MTTTLEHFEPGEMPPATKMFGGLTIAPAMAAIIVNCVPIVDPQVAAIIRDNAETVVTSPVDPHAACPAHSEVIASVETRPFATCIAVVHIVFPTSHVRSPTVQVLAMAPLSKVERIFHEETMAIMNGIAGAVTSATCAHNKPTVASIRTMISEKHASMTTTFKHFKPH
jgi:hypothetical protein